MKKMVPAGIALAAIAALIAAPSVAFAAEEVATEETAVVEQIDTTTTEEAAPSEQAPQEPVVEETASEEPAPEPAPSTEPVPERVCEPFDTGHLSAGNATTYEINAPPGKLIVAVCVKAGSSNQGYGPEVTSPLDPVKTLTIKHSSGKEISHYSVKYKDEPKADPPTNSCVPGSGVHSTNLVDLWTNVDTRADGRVEYVDGGLHVWTLSNTSAAKVSEGIAHSFPLKNTGVLDLAWTGSTPPPGINLFVNFGADGNGTLVYESVYGQDLWLTNGSSAAVKANAPVNGGGNGSQWHGTINQWLEKYPDAQVVGIAYSLGSGVLGDGVISSITVNCTVFTFDYVEPAEEPEPVTETKTERTVDCFADTVTEQDYERTTGEPTYDPQTNTWTQGEFGPWEPVGEPRVTEATDEDCPLPPSEQTFGEWVYEVDCDTEVGDEVPATREVTTVTYSYNEQGEVVPASSISTEEGTHVVTAEDLEGLECPAPPVTPEEPEEPAAPSGNRSGGLAATGMETVYPITLGALGVVLLIGGGLALALRRRSLQH